MVWTMFIPSALHGVEASLLAKGCMLKLRAAFLGAVWVTAAAISQCWCGPEHAGWTSDLHFVVWSGSSFV